MRLVFDLGKHAMDGALDLDDHRRIRAKDDATRNMLCIEFEEVSVQQAKAIQREFTDDWGL